MLALGGVSRGERRLQQDTLFDTASGALRAAGVTLRVRHEPDGVTLTCKGPVQPGPLKVREEDETRVADPRALRAMLARLGYEPWFRSDKYREEFAIGATTVAVDDTPIGSFIEIEGDEAEVLRLAEALGTVGGAPITDSYRYLYLRDCEHRGVAPADMTFPGTT